MHGDPVIQPYNCQVKPHPITSLLNDITIEYRRFVTTHVVFRSGLFMSIYQSNNMSNNKKHLQ